MPVHEDIARWALQSGEVTRASITKSGPSLAYNIVHSAPRAVYTGGFRHDSPEAHPDRFTGKAVTFLSVAKFETD